MRRRLDLARAMLHDPRLLLADEPTSGLDEPSFQRTWKQLEELTQDGTAGVLVTTHRPEEAERCDRLIILNQGTMVAMGTPEALKSQLKEDLVILKGDNPAGLCKELEAMGLEANQDGEFVHVQCERGHEWIVRIVERLPEGRLHTISLRHPDLGEAFLQLTGETLDGCDETTPAPQAKGEAS
jgi:ABC-2 type transport system ATP-binding protein